MEEDSQNRQKIENLMKERPWVIPTAIRDALSDEGIEITPDEAIEQIKEINKSTDEQILVAPPECKDCGYEDWNKKTNIPSQCPECKSEWIKEPRFKIE